MTESSKLIQITDKKKFNWTSCSKCCHPVVLDEIGTVTLEDEIEVNGQGRCSLCNALNVKILLIVNVKAQEP